ncbi:MAG: hypothetical protein V4696_01525 [Pseudomonadota bacterium]
MIERLIRAMRRTVSRWRSSITGRFVTKDYAEANPETTTKETER